MNEMSERKKCSLGGHVVCLSATRMQRYDRGEYLSCTPTQEPQRVALRKVTDRVCVYV